MIPHYDPTTGIESEDARKKRIQNVIDAGKGMGLEPITCINRLLS